MGLFSIRDVKCVTCAYWGGERELSGNWGSSDCINANWESSAICHKKGSKEMGWNSCSEHVICPELAKFKR